jgi:hypothetical protein
VVKYGIAVLLLFFCIDGYAQNKTMTYPDFVGKSLSSIKQNRQWTTLKEVSGDLNNDGKADVALILESTNSLPEKRGGGNFQKGKPRIILVFLSIRNKKQVIEQNNKFIARDDEGGMMPHLTPKLSIEKGTLTIEYDYTRDSQSYDFRYRNGKIVIVSAAGSGYESGSGNYQNVKYDFVKNRIILKSGNVSADKEKTKVIEIRQKPKSLSEFGEMYDWKIYTDCYL